MSVHRYGKYKVTDKATGEVHYLSADELARIPSTRPARGRGKLIQIRDIPQKSYVRHGKKHERESLKGHHADIVPGVSIRLHGLETNRHGGPKHYDITFKVGDHAVYGSYNLVYTGKIVSIGAKTVAIKEDHGSKVHKLDIATFSGRNSDYDAAKISKRNSEWMD